MALDRYYDVRFGPQIASESVREAVLELTYTVHDMAPLASDLGHVEDFGRDQAAVPVGSRASPAPARSWTRCSFTATASSTATTYGTSGSTFPIIERQDVQAFGRYRSRDLCLAYMNALAAGRPDVTPDV